MRKPLGLHRRPRFRRNLTLHQCVGFAGDDNFPWLSRLLQPGRQINLAPDDGVLHTQGATKVADITKPGVDAYAYRKRLVDTHLAPARLQLAHARLHGDGHVDALHRIFANTQGVRIAKKNHDRVANEFVQCGAVLGGDLRHFGEVTVQQQGDLLGLPLCRRLGEVLDI